MAFNSLTGIPSKYNTFLPAQMLNRFRSFLDLLSSLLSDNHTANILKQDLYNR